MIPEFVDVIKKAIKRFEKRINLTSLKAPSFISPEMYEAVRGKIFPD